MINMISVYLGACALILLVLLYLEDKLYRWRMRRKTGLDGPSSVFLFGNLTEISKANVPSIQKWIKKYGPASLHFVGRHARIVVSDLELVQRILIRDFHNFGARNFFTDSVDVKSRDATSVIRANGYHWKRVRTLLRYGFSTSKLRANVPIISGSIDRLMSIIESKKDAEFDVFPLFQGLSMEVIGKYSFGVQTTALDNPDDEFLAAAKSVFDNNVDYLFRIILIFPILDKSLLLVRRFLDMFKKSKRTRFFEFIELILEGRKSGNVKRNDHLQAMLDASINSASLDNTDNFEITSSEDTNVELPDNEQQVANGSKSAVPGVYSKLKLNTYDILANSAVLFLAGYETTSTALTFTLHFLAHYPEAQEKCRQEVERVIAEEGGQMSYSAISKLDYVEACINESMRILPPITTFVTRVATEEYKYKDITIPAGGAVLIPVFEIHSNPDIWPEPNVFRPERFMPENRDKIPPCAFLAFGAGPRNCLGLRLAVTESKLTIASLLRRFKFTPGPSAEKPDDLKLDYRVINQNPLNGIWIRAHPINT